MNELTILLVEDDPNVCKTFAEVIEKSEDISLVSVTNNAMKALEDIKDFLPNVVILDLELHHGKGSGLDVLKGLHEMVNFDLRPYMLITTNNVSSITYDCARELGADYIFSKHQDDYSIENVLDFLRMMKTSILNKQKLLQHKHEVSDTPERQKKRIRRRIMSELNLVNVNPKSVGYVYLIDAIELSIESPRQNISTIIGQMHGKTDFSVERAMQNAIKRAWNSANPEDLYNNYTAKISSEKGIPTITEFIHYYALKLANEYDA